jgi:hypothetical protein
MSSGLLLRNYREKWRDFTMAKDDRDMLELLKQELSFIRRAGMAVRSARLGYQSPSSRTL